MRFRVPLGPAVALGAVRCRSFRFSFPIGFFYWSSNDHWGSFGAVGRMFQWCLAAISEWFHAFPTVLFSLLF